MRDVAQGASSALPGGAAGGWSGPNPSELERTLFGIVDNLLLYRPYLPDTLFQPRAALNETPAEVTDCAVDRCARPQRVVPALPQDPTGGQPHLGI